MLIVQAAPHPDNMAIAARLAFQPAMPAALTLPQHAPAAHFISTASHFTLPINANRGHYIPFNVRSKSPFHHISSIRDDKKYGFYFQQVPLVNHFYVT